MTRTLALAAVVVFWTSASAEDAGLIRVIGDAATRTFRADGKLVKTTDTAPRRGQLSPDGKQRAYISAAGDEALMVCDADGQNARRITPEAMTAGFHVWSPDGKRLVFLGRPFAAPGTFQAAHWQLHAIDADGKNLKPLAASLEGVGMLRFSADGRLSYLRYYLRDGKIQRSDLVVGEGDAAKAVLKNVFIIDYAWSPDSKLVAYSKPGELVFHEVATGKEQTVVFADIQPTMRGHGAWNLTFNPASDSVACTIMFFGDRQARGPKMFGDDELFVIPREGKATWFQPGLAVRGLAWVKE